MLRNLTVPLAATLLLASSAAAFQFPPPATQPAQLGQPAAPQTVDEVLSSVDQTLSTAKEITKQGRTMQAQQMLTQTQEALTAVLNADPKNTRALVLAAEVAKEMGNQHEARRLFKTALETDPYNFRANLGLGIFYTDNRMWRQAAAFLQNAKSVAPRDRLAEVLRWLARALAGQGKRQEAFQAAEDAVRADPTATESLQLLVEMYAGVGQFDRAVVIAEHLVQAAGNAREAEPANPWMIKRLIEAYETQANALKSYHNALYRRDARDQPTDQLLPGREAEAAAVLNRLAKSVMDAAKARWELAHHDALMMMEMAVEFQPQHTGYLLDLGTLLLATQQPGRAAGMFQHLLEIQQPTDPDPAQVEKNREAARDYLKRLNVPVPATQQEPTAP